MHITSTWHITLKWSPHISRMMGQQPHRHHYHHHIVLMGRPRPLHPCNPKPWNKVLTWNLKWYSHWDLHLVGKTSWKSMLSQPFALVHITHHFNVEPSQLHKTLENGGVMTSPPPPPPPHCLLYNRSHIARTPKPLYNHSISSGFVLKQCSKLLLVCVIALWVGPE
jgi:hypothetical protein